MTVAMDILCGTPPWVFLLAALLVWLGVRSLRPRVTTVVRVWMTPAVFIIWGLTNLAAGGSSAQAFVWLFTASGGLIVAWVTVRMHGLVVDRVHGLVLVPASVLPLMRNVAVFSAKYALAVSAVLYPEVRGQLAVWDAAVSGVSAGYFLGWAIRFALASRSAPAADLTVPRGALSEAAVN